MKDTHSSTVKLMLSPYYKFNDNFAAGIGTGYDLDRMNVSSIPLYAHANYRIKTDSKFTPLIGLKTGYSFLSKKHGIVGDVAGQSKLTGGFFLSPSIGFAYKINKRQSLLFSVSYYWLQYRHEREFANHPEFSTSKNLTNSVISINIGYEF